MSSKGSLPPKKFLLKCRSKKGYAKYLALHPFNLQDAIYKAEPEYIHWITKMKIKIASGAMTIIQSRFSIPIIGCALLF